ncbi:putative F0F1-ATPase subunit [bacterium BMS3Bbin04]|nr:putative F0F1-ATPase subunit [bacterium BMS3Bbin04]
MLSPGRDKERAQYGGWIDLGIQTGLTLALSVVLLTLGGRWLDEQLGTTPLFLIVGALWGALGGTWWVIIRVKRFSEAEEKRDEAGGDEDEGK